MLKINLCLEKGEFTQKNCCSYREDLPLDWTFLLPFGSKLCQKPHSNYCFCFWAPAHIVVIILLRSPDSGVPVSSWAVLLFLQTLWCKHIPRTLWCHQHLLCCEHAVYSKILFIYHWLRCCYLMVLCTLLICAQFIMIYSVYYTNIKRKLFNVLLKFRYILLTHCFQIPSVYVMSELEEIFLNHMNTSSRMIACNIL